MNRVIAIFLGLVIFSASLGFTFSTHYCGGKPVKSAFSLVKQNLGCGGIEMEAKCDDDGTLTLEKKGCCENKFHQLKLKENLENPSGLTKSIDPGPNAVTGTTESFDIFVSENRIIEYLNYIPPLLFKNIRVIVQSFLI